MILYGVVRSVCFVMRHEIYKSCTLMFFVLVEGTYSDLLHLCSCRQGSDSLFQRYESFGGYSKCYVTSFSYNSSQGYVSVWIFLR